MAQYIVKDCNPQFQGGNYYVGRRPMKDKMGRECMAADFGPRSEAYRFRTKEDALKCANEMNHVARQKIFQVEEDMGASYGFRYGAPSQSRQTNGFVGYDGLPPQRME